MSRLVLALDVGRTTLAGGLVSADGALTFARRVPAADGGRAGFDALVDLADAVLREAGSPVLQGIGVSLATNLPGWPDFPLGQRLEAVHSGSPVRVQGAAVCFAVAEHWVGAASGSANVLGVHVSTEIGGGLILDGRLFSGGSGQAGAIGHLVVDPVGPICSCGGIGCLQAIASGPNVVAWAREHGWIAAGSAGTPELAASARAGDPVAAAALALAGSAVGIAIASTAALLDLDLVVVGGGLAESGEVLLGPLRRAVKRHLYLPSGARLEILASGLGDTAALVGAAALVHRGDVYSPAG